MRVVSCICFYILNGFVAGTSESPHENSQNNSSHHGADSHSVQSKPAERVRWRPNVLFNFNIRIPQGVGVALIGGNAVFQNTYHPYLVFSYLAVIIIMMKYKCSCVLTRTQPMTGQNTSAPLGKSTTTTVELRSPSGRSPKTCWRGKPPSMKCNHLRRNVLNGEFYAPAVSA